MSAICFVVLARMSARMTSPPRSKNAAAFAAYSTIAAERKTARARFLETGIRMAPPSRRGASRPLAADDAVGVPGRELLQEGEPVVGRVPRRGAREEVLVLFVGGEDPV